MKFLYTPNPDADEPIMLVNKHIGHDEKGIAGILGDIFQNELFELERRGKKRVEVLVNTVGGGVTDGWNIYGAIRIVNSREVTQVDTLNIGIAASTGGWIFQAGKVRRMMDYAILMMHNPHGGDEKGNESITNSIATMLCAKSNKTEDQVLELMNRTTFMEADECEANRLCDTVLPSDDSAPEMIHNAATITAKWSLANTIYNKYLETDNMDLSKVTNELSLNADAKVESMVEAISKLKNTIADLTNSADGSENARKDMEDKLNKSKEAYDKLKNDYDKMCNEAKEAENKQKDTEAENLAKEYANKGRIVNDEKTIGEWKNTALTLGIDKTKSMLDGLPVNKMAPAYTPSADTVSMPKNMASAMAKKDRETK